MLSSVVEDIAELDCYPDFGEYYQNYIKTIQDSIISNEVAVNEYKMVRMKSLNCVLTQLNELTEELKTL